MATFLFLTVSIFLVLIKYKREGNIVNLISVLIAPYAILVIINNFIMSHFGFYKISDSSLYLYIFSFVCFFIGTLPNEINPNVSIDEQDNQFRFEKYNMSGMCLILIVIGTIGILKLIINYRNGSFNAANFNDVEGMMGSGPVGHLLLLSYSLFPIVFLYWTYNKKKIIYLISVLLITIVTFSTFIKYNVIGLAVSTFLFVLIYRKSILKKSILLLVSFVILVFVGNYAIGFFAQGLSVNPIFYLNHFWSYASGSLINSNRIFTDGLNAKYDLLDKILICTMSIPRMFVGRISGREIFSYDIMPFFPISRTGEVTNVIDALSYFYPSKGSKIDIFIYFVFIIAIGYIFSAIYTINKKSYMFNTTINLFLTYFVFFSFFGTFYINAGPWEIIIYSLIIPYLFYDKRKLVIKIGRKTIL